MALNNSKLKLLFNFGLAVFPLMTIRKAACLMKIKAAPCNYNYNYSSRVHANTPHLGRLPQPIRVLTERNLQYFNQSFTIHLCVITFLQSLSCSLGLVPIDEKAEALDRGLKGSCFDACVFFLKLLLMSPWNGTL